MPQPSPKSMIHTGNRTAVIDRGETHSYDSIHSSAHILAEELSRTHFSPGDRIAAVLPNSTHAVIAFLAAAKTGQSYLPLNIGLKRPELELLFHKCSIRVVMCPASLKSHIPDGIETVVVDELIADGRAGSIPAPGEWPSLEPGRPFICLSTSGSTGEPRIVERTARAVFANAQRVADALQVTREDRFLSVVPFWHANGFSNCLLMPLVSGASIVTMNRFLPRSMLEMILESKPTVVIGSPFIFLALSKVIKPGDALGHVRAWISSGASLSGDLDERLRKLHVPVRELYGSSETGTISISSARKSREGQVGKPLPGVQVRVVDADGHEVPPGQPGEVQVSSTSVFSGYVGEPGATSQMTEDGFYSMSDRGTQDEAGNLCLSGRTDAMINISGIKVDPLEIQRVLTSVPGIQQALVFGILDVNGMEMIKALLVADDEISTEDILEHCRRQLAEYKLPRTIEFVDAIPQDLMGKSARSRLEK